MDGKADFDRLSALWVEVEVSVELVRAGLAYLKGLDSDVDPIDLPLLLLSGGLERLSKCIIAYDIRAKSGRWPTREEIPRTHDVDLLLSRLWGAFDDHYLASADRAADFAFAQTDEGLRRITAALSEFGNNSPVRYYNLDFVAGSDSPKLKSPAATWSQVEKHAFDERFYDIFFGKHRWDDPNHVTVADNVGRIERLVRALVRLFTASGVSRIAFVDEESIADFLTLTDDRLGKINYRLPGIPWRSRLTRPLVRLGRWLAWLPRRLVRG